ncbi:universal stress protein YxiE-like [Crassostrea angulata]|uniref:universal stress protein YxiE-like n=1 Tax=Magallana angulata TaxID=2784310 RepID=UPI0022B14BDD|nr:universal stress protein YxiE-like [Crassostrea angulata]
MSSESESVMANIGPNIGERRNVLIAMDGSDYAEGAFNWYMEHVHRADEDHALLVNIADHSHSLTHGSAWMSADPKLVEHAIREEEKKAKEMEKKLEGYLVETGIEGQVIITKGDPGPTLIKLADEFNAAYIVTGTRGHGKIRRTILGSVSDYVMHHSHVPVLIYRS